MRKINITKLIYLEDENYFIDIDGHIVYDIFRHLTPNQLVFLKKRRISYTFKKSFKDWVSVTYIYDTLTRICDEYKHG